MKSISYVFEFDGRAISLAEEFHERL